MGGGGGFFGNMNMGFGFDDNDDFFNGGFPNMQGMNGM